MFDPANMMISSILEVSCASPKGAADDPYVTNPISDDKKKNTQTKYFSEYAM
jgi:hypothetical protein